MATELEWRHARGEVRPAPAPPDAAVPAVARESRGRRATRASQPVASPTGEDTRAAEREAARRRASASAHAWPAGGGVATDSLARA